jgi:hypothetical protein
LKQGKGCLAIKINGDTYDGEWDNDKMSGHGKYTFNLEKKVFEGSFVEGTPYGFGKLSCANFLYQGSFKSGIFEGQGKF